VIALLQKVNLYDVRKKSLSSFSGGMKQRFGIAQALLGDPKLIIVDEPTAGLGPGERNRFYNLLSEIGENRIVILSTHIVDDVKELCSNMAIIDKGTLLYSGSPGEALNLLSGKIWAKYISKTEVPEFMQRYNVISTRMVAGRPLIHAYSDTDPGEGFAQSDADLEDVFFSRIARLN
jgi:ABC-type multidrug transport system ATPase subunit